MKTKNYLASACAAVAMVFGFSACTYDAELHPPQHLVEKAAAQNHEGAGKTTTFETGTRVTTPVPQN